LLFHRPPPPAPDRAIEVMVERLEIRVALPRMAPLVRGRATRISRRSTMTSIARSGAGGGG